MSDHFIPVGAAMHVVLLRLRDKQVSPGAKPAAPFLTDDAQKREPLRAGRKP